MPRTSAEIQAEIHQHVFAIGVADVNAECEKRPHLKALDALSDELQTARQIETAIEATKTAPPEKPAPLPSKRNRK